jgi:positive regulator of sigma E activity
MYLLPYGFLLLSLLLEQTLTFSFAHTLAFGFAYTFALSFLFVKNNLINAY